MKLIITPSNPLRGTAAVPGDKSLSHRAVLFAALAEGESRIEHFLVSGVTRVMLNALRAMGVEWNLEGDVLTVYGRGLKGLRPPEHPLQCGNSATTIRLLAGALAAAGIPAVLDGSQGLRKRPMERIIAPLREMGALIDAAPGGTAPLSLRARPAGVAHLRSIEAVLPVASAQVKTCLLLAALAADGPVILREPGPSRDHSERMLRSMGVNITARTIDVDGMTWYETRIEPPAGPLHPIRMALPGDFSAAAFLIAAGTIVPGSDIVIPGVGLNPTRTGLIDALRAMGADIEIEDRSETAGEPAGRLWVRAAALRGTLVEGPLVVRMIDEFSILGAAAAFAAGETRVRDAAELRYKETDRIQTLCEELRSLGVEAVEAADGFVIQGLAPEKGLPGGAVVNGRGDHRLAMALTVLGLAAGRPVEVEGAEIIDESFPGFVAALRDLGAQIEVLDAQPA